MYPLSKSIDTNDWPILMLCLPRISTPVHWTDDEHNVITQRNLISRFIDYLCLYLFPLSCRDYAMWQTPANATTLVSMEAFVYRPTPAQCASAEIPSTRECTVNEVRIMSRNETDWKRQCLIRVVWRKTESCRQIGRQEKHNRTDVLFTDVQQNELSSDIYDTRKEINLSRRYLFF